MNNALDTVDARLLQLLEHDGRASLRSLADAIGLSGPAVADRINRLTDRGIIRRFSVDIDWARLGLPTLAQIALLTDKTQHIENVVARLREVERIEEVSIVTGSTDLLVRARVTDLTDLRRLLVEKIWPIEGIQRVETTLAVETIQVPEFATNLLADIAPTNEASRS